MRSVYREEGVDRLPLMSDLTRRRFQQSLALGALGAALGCRDGASPHDEAPVRSLPPLRGILLLTADDLGWRDVGAYGLTAVPTPHLDRLIAGGVAFDRAFDVVSTCSSSRASLATGQYPHTHGVTGLTHRHPELSLPADAPTVARQLADHGFTTAIQGKFHISATHEPEAFGYQDWLATDLDQRIRDISPAVDFLAEQGESSVPFFLEVNFMQTHRDLLDRFVQADGYEVAVDEASPPSFWGLPDWPELREEVAGYLSQLRWMDDMVGALLDALDDGGLADDVLVAFVSDNGPPFPGCKLTLYDRGVGTPLVFRWPAALAPAWSDELVGTVQIAPTLLELAGVDPLPGAQGRSLAPLLLGEPFDAAEAVFAEMEEHIDPVPARAVRTDRYKYIRNLSATPWGHGDGSADYLEPLADEPDQRWDEPRPPEELYDLSVDPLERANLVDDPALADVLTDLRARLVANAEATADFRLGEL